MQCSLLFCPALDGSYVSKPETQALAIIARERAIVWYLCSGSAGGVAGDNLSTCSYWQRMQRKQGDQGKLQGNPWIHRLALACWT